ncbi:hypothetical protein GCM10010468_56420 [Actinocorallia longicatena]|uniref:Uncharacterized protein n=1 Tax=Actinocorallia longicatena TaxID=111803 RepID=A0ABP6QFX1_9ACTN
MPAVARRARATDSRIQTGQASATARWRKTASGEAGENTVAEAEGMPATVRPRLLPDKRPPP